jgi:hypothetical protein
VSCVIPLQYNSRSFTVGQIEVGFGMRDRTQRYINAACPFAISETSCPSHVRPVRQVSHVFRPEKRIMAGKVYLSVGCALGATTSILFAGKCGKLHNQCSNRLAFIVVVPVYSLSCYCSCMQLSSHIRGYMC